MSLLLRDLSPEELAFEVRRLFGTSLQGPSASFPTVPYRSDFPGALTLGGSLPTSGYSIPQHHDRAPAQYGVGSALDDSSGAESLEDVDYAPGTGPVVPVNKGPKPRHPALEECYEHCFQDWLFNTTKICGPLWGRSMARRAAYAKCMAKEGEKQGSCIADCNRAANRAPRNDGY
jgi:hypothetical protein